ncbi:hypothetical protein C7E15_22990, partial [Stenotrophomonas maltophilia]
RLLLTSLLRGSGMDLGEVVAGTGPKPGRNSRFKSARLLLTSLLRGSGMDLGEVVAGTGPKPGRNSRFK